MAFVIINDLSGGTTSTVRCGQNNAALAAYSTVSGGRNNTAVGTTSPATQTAENPVHPYVNNYTF